MLTSARRGQDDQAWPVTMTAEAPQGPVTAGVRSLEVRWIFPGQLAPPFCGPILQSAPEVSGTVYRFPLQSSCGS